MSLQAAGWLREACALSCNASEHDLICCHAASFEPNLGQNEGRAAQPAPLGLWTGNWKRKP